MIIKHKNYEIEVTENSYDLYQSRPPKQTHLTKGKEEIRCCHGYFTKLPSAIRKIIQIEMSNREETVILTDYLKLYRSLLGEAEKQIEL